MRFGASPLLHAVLSARQLDADRFVAEDNNRDNDHAAEPMRLLPGLRALIAALPQAPIPAQIEFSSEQIMLGGRPLQNLAADLHADTPESWTIDRLDFRAPGATRVDLSGADAQPGPSGSFKGALDVESSDPDTLVAWLQGRSEISYRSQKPLRLRGDVSVGADRVAIEAMKAEIDGGAVAGGVAVSNPSAGGGSRFDAELKADRLDLDAATAFVRSLAGPQAEWPDEAQVSLDIGRAISAGQELHPLTGEARLRSQGDYARSTENRPGERRDAGRRGQFRPRPRHGPAGAEFNGDFARPDHRPDRAIRARSLRRGSMRWERVQVPRASS